MDTSGMDVPNSRAIAAQLLVLSQDPENQQYIVQEQGCMAGLVGYLDHPEHEVALMATRALQFLSSNARNKRPMAVFPGLVSELVSFVASLVRRSSIRQYSHKNTVSFCFAWSYVVQICLVLIVD
jgi:FtsH-binding integral membrane protein